MKLHKNEVELVKKVLTGNLNKLSQTFVVKERSTNA